MTTFVDPNEQTLASSSKLSYWVQKGSSAWRALALHATDLFSFPVFHVASKPSQSDPWIQSQNQVTELNLQFYPALSL